MRRAIVVAVLALVAITGGIALAVSIGGPTAPTAPIEPSPPLDTNASLTVHFLDVGQGAATFIRTPTNETILVDSGSFHDRGEAVLRYLVRNNVSRLDHLVTSHADADHIGGHAAVIEYFETVGDGVGAIYDPGQPATTATYRRYLEAVDRYNVTLFETRAGDTIPSDSVTLAFLWPTVEAVQTGDRNDNSLVLSLRYGNTSFLFPGDAGERVESALLADSHQDLPSTVLLASHHGSRTGTSAAFLDIVQPRVVVISSAYASQYDHPHTVVLDRLAARSIPTYWTATHGDIVLTSDGQVVTIEPQVAAPTDARRLRDAPPVDQAGTTELESLPDIAGLDPLAVVGVDTLTRAVVALPDGTVTGIVALQGVPTSHPPTTAGPRPCRGAT